jgi:hypothetical protein
MIRAAIRVCGMAGPLTLAPAIRAAAFGMTLLGDAPWEAHADTDDCPGCLPGPSDCAYLSALGVTAAADAQSLRRPRPATGRSWNTPLRTRNPPWHACQQITAGQR